METHQAERRAGTSAGRGTVTSYLAALLAAVTIFCGCSTEGDEAGNGTSPNAGVGSRLRPTRGTILISIDTLRADHLGHYGYSRDTSPFLDEFATRGFVFENAISPIPSTLPAHVSMPVSYTHLTLPTICSV